MPVTDLDNIRRLASQRRDEFEVLMYRLQYDDNIADEWLDAVVDRIAAPIIAQIDCTQCGNCCRALHVAVTPPDVARLAHSTGMSSGEFEATYVDHKYAQQHGEWGVINRRPCPFLDGKLCSVYAQRPKTCREYPFLTPDFRWTMDELIEGSAICPIIYNVLHEVAERVDEIQRNANTTA